MKHCKWLGILLLLAIIIFFQSGFATTDIVYVSVNGDTSVTTAVQGDLINWASNCAVGASTRWEVYFDIDSNHVIDEPGDKQIYQFIIIDGAVNGIQGPGDNNPVPDGIISIPEMIIGFAPGYYIFRGTDLTDSTSAEDWVQLTPYDTPPNMFTGLVNISGHAAPDPLLKNIWIVAENSDNGQQMWSALTNDTGYYEINVGDAGTDLSFRITAEALSGRVTPAEQNLSASGQVDGVDFYYDAPSDSVYGVLKDNNDSLIPVSGFYAQPNFSGPSSKDVSTTNGHYVIYFGASELGSWNIGVSGDNLIPTYMVPQLVQIDNSIEHNIERNFTAYPADTVIYAWVTEAGGEPVNQYRLQAQSMTLSNFTEAVSGTGADNLVTLHVSSLETSGYNISLATWDNQYPIPPGYIVPNGQIQNVHPGDTVNINLITGIMVQDTIKVAQPDPGVNWNALWVNLWSPGKSFGVNPDNAGVFAIYGDTGVYTLNVAATRYLSNPQSRNVHVTGDTTGGLGFTVNYAQCHVTGFITGVPFPLDSNLMVSGFTSTWPDGYSQGAKVDLNTGAFDMYVCDGSWTFNPPSILGAIAPASHPINIGESDTSYTFNFAYQRMYHVSDTVKVDPGDPGVNWGTVQVRLMGPGGNYFANPDNNGVFHLYADSGLYNLTVFYNNYLSDPDAYPIHLTDDTVGGLGLILNKIDAHISGHLIGMDLPLPSNSLHINASAGTYPDGFHTTSVTIDSITGEYHIYVCNGSWTFTAPELSGYFAPNTWEILVAEEDTVMTHDFSYISSGVSDNNGSVIPKDFSLWQNSPNPFNMITRIEFALPIKSTIELGIYNILGQKVKILAQGEYTAGVYAEDWDGTNQSGHSVASGIYFYRLNAGDNVMLKKMVLLK